MESLKVNNILQSKFADELFLGIKNIIFAFGSTLLIVMLTTWFMKRFELADFQLFSKEDNKTWFYSIIGAPMCEEFIFRLVPISAAIIVIGQARFDKIKWHYAFFLALIFGFFHHGYANVYIQGVGGFFLAYLYFKNKLGYLSAVVAHALWNLSVGFIIPYFISQPPPNPFGWY
jgi:membrane protease YdiL (CAAX protease family)